MSHVKFRFAEKKDCKLILEFIKDLAAYEKMLDEVIATEDLLNEWLFEKEIAEVIFVMEDDVEVGFALFSITSQHFLERQEFIWKTCS